MYVCSGFIYLISMTFVYLCMYVCVYMGVCVVEYSNSQWG